MAEVAALLGFAATLTNVAAVTQLLANAGGLISKINKEAKTARQNMVECEHLASRVSTIGGVLSRLPRDPEVARPLAELNTVLQKADRLVVACQKGSTVFRASRRADKFKEVNARILSDMAVLTLSLLSYITHNERRVYWIFDPDYEHIVVHYRDIKESCDKSNLPSGSSNTLRRSLEMTGLPTELKSLEGIMLDANAEPGRLSYQFLRSITRNFSQEIGRGGFGVVYLGELGTGKVAVKKLSISQRFSDTDFMDEINCLKRTKHNNVVRFLGYCFENHGELVPLNGRYVLAEVPQRLLCLEYVPNGNLQKYLQDKSNRDEWQIRYKMIREICHGLNYLHGQRINHLDLKPENILLGACMEPKITDFGLSRCFDEGISRVYTKTVRGTMGCIAPETINCGEITFKSDIYGLGIIIVKLLTGNHNYDFENWHTTVDVDSPQVKSCIEIAQTCVVHDQHERPSIVEIIQKLNEIEML